MQCSRKLSGTGSGAGRGACPPSRAAGQAQGWPCCPWCPLCPCCARAQQQDWHCTAPDWNPGFVVSQSKAPHALSLSPQTPSHGGAFMGPSRTTRWVTPASIYTSAGQNRADLGLCRPFLPPLPTGAYPSGQNMGTQCCPGLCTGTGQKELIPVGKGWIQPVRILPPLLVEINIPINTG